MRHVRCVWYILAVLALAGCDDPKWKKSALEPEEIEQRTFAPKPERAETLHVSGETITCDDIIAEPPGEERSDGTFKDKLMAVARETTLEQFKEITRSQMRQRLNNNISTVVLYKQARRQLGDKVDETLDKLVEKEWRRIILEKYAGNEVQAVEALKQGGWTRAAYLASLKKTMLAQYSYSTSVKQARERPITYGELVAGYDQMKGASFATPASVQFRLIDIQPDKVEVTDPNEDRLSKTRAVAEGLLTRIRAGEDFAALAKEHSHGIQRETGGLWPVRDPGSFVQPYDSLAQKAMGMQVGEVAGPIETPGHFFLLKLEQKQVKGYRPLKEVQKQVEQKILDDRYKEALHRLDTEIANQTSMVNTNIFLDRCLESIYKQARAQAGS